MKMMPNYVLRTFEAVERNGEKQLPISCSLSNSLELELCKHRALRARAHIFTICTAVSSTRNDSFGRSDDLSHLIEWQIEI